MLCMKELGSYENGTLGDTSAPYALVMATHGVDWYGKCLSDRRSYERALRTHHAPASLGSYTPVSGISRLY